MIKNNAMCFFGIFFCIVSFSFAANIKEDLELYKKQIDPHLPIQIDSETKLDALKVNNKKLVFEYTLSTLTKKEFATLADKLKTTLKAKIKTDSCETPNLKQYLEKGAEFQYIYKDKSGKHKLISFDISKSSC